MERAIRSTRLIRFANYEVDLDAGELRRNDRKLKLSGQPFQVLAALLEHPGDVVRREDLQKRLWPDTFVDVEHNLNTAINKIREVLGDSAENPRFVETLSRRGYRFIAPVNGTSELVGTGPDRNPSEVVGTPSRHLRKSILAYSAGIMTVLLVLAPAVVLHYRSRAPLRSRQRALTRVTFDPGLQKGATWSPDGRFIAYSSDRGGKFDIWVQQVGEANPVQVTHGPDQNWQPDWSPDGKYIAYRSEEGDGGIYIIPALGGAGLTRKIASMGYHPHWSPDGTQILFQTTQYLGQNRFYVATLGGGELREVLTQFEPQHGSTIMSAAWHPDGKRISAWVPGARTPDFWTVSLAGGAPVRSEFTPEVDQQLKEAGIRGIVEWVPDFNFSWSPSGRAIYCALTFRGAVNLWKLAIDPRTLRITRAERLTTGPGPDGGIGLSADGRKLAFTSQSQHIWAWVFPFDANRGEVKGPGEAASPDATTAWRLSMSQDGKKLAFSGHRSGQFEIWQRSLSHADSTPIVADDQLRDQPRWSRDGEYLLYERDSLKGDDQLIYWSAKTGNEQVICDAKEITGGLDWSPNGDQILVSQIDPSTHHLEIWMLPLPGLSRTEGSGQRMVSDPAYDLSQPNFSPDGRWIAFQAVKDLSRKLESTLYVMPATGGPWVRISDGKHWDDKPRWSPDGKILYFISGRSGFFNVWAIHFDPSQGKVVGTPSMVTNFNSPARMMPEHEPSVDISVTRDKLALTLEQDSGGIWMLDNVEQ